MKKNAYCLTIFIYLSIFYISFSMSNIKAIILYFKYIALDLGTFGK